MSLSEKFFIWKNKQETHTRKEENIANKGISLYKTTENGTRENLRQRQLVQLKSLCGTQYYEAPNVSYVFHALSNYF